MSKHFVYYLGISLVKFRVVIKLETIKESSFLSKPKCRRLEIGAFGATLYWGDKIYSEKNYKIEYS